VPTKAYTSLRTGTKSIEVRLRVDCRLGANGVDGDDMIQMLGLIPAFADRWYPHIKDAMEKGFFDAAGSQRSPHDEKLESVAKRCGGINRIEALLRQQRRKDRPEPSGGSEPLVNGWTRNTMRS